MSDASPAFESIRNFFEAPVVAAVRDAAARYPLIEGEMLADVACVALNRLPTRYIRHSADLAFYLGDKERVQNELAVREAVDRAFEFVQAREAMRARA